MKTKFNKIYCLHLADNKDRLENFNNEIKKINLLLEVNIWWTTKRKISEEIGLKITSFHTWYYDYLGGLEKTYIYAGVFNCSIEHYTIIKLAYERGFNSILIMEDDIKFIGPIEKIEKYFNELPEDYDIIRYYTTHTPYIDDETKKKHLFITDNYKQLSSTLLYALSRNGMKLVIDSYDNKFDCADLVLDNLLISKKCKFYTATDYVCIPDNFISNIIKS